MGTDPFFRKSERRSLLEKTGSVPFFRGVNRAGAKRVTMGPSLPGGRAMKILVALSTSALALAACASNDDARYAENDCRVAPVVTTGPGASSRVSHLDQRYAEMQLATSDYRMRNLQRDPSYATNNIEQGLNGCANASSK